MDVVFQIDSHRKDPWIYFVAGALLPTLAYALRVRSGRSAVKKNDERVQQPQERLNSSSDQAEHATSSKNTTNAVDAAGCNENEDFDSDDEDEDEMNLATTGGPSSKWGFAHEPYKMVFCVNTSLKSMGKGKMAAQCCHAAVGCYKRALKQCPKALEAWEYTGCAKICVKCPEEDEMLEIAAMALSLDIPIYLVQDAGRTQIAAGSKTVLGLFGPVSVLTGVTDHLKLM